MTETNAIPHIISLGAGVQSSTMALMAAHGEITPMPTAAIFAETQPIRQRQGDDQRFTNICWSDSEKGLQDELFEAVLNVVRARCEKATAEWRAI